MNRQRRLVVGQHNTALQAGLDLARRLLPIAFHSNGDD
jgi:hypothetical protein